MRIKIFQAVLVVIAVAAVMLSVLCVRALWLNKSYADGLTVCAIVAYVGFFFPLYMHRARLKS